MLAVLALASAAAPLQSYRHLSIVGATSSLAYLRAAVSGWERLNPGVTVSISGGGSVAGLVEVSHGRADVGVSDVPPESRWIGGTALKATPLGRLPILFIAHSDVGIGRLTKSQLRAVLSGKIRSWAELGGSRSMVIVMTRPISSGALNVVEKRVLAGNPLSRKAIVELSNGAMLAAVRETPGAVGFLETGIIPRGVATLEVGGTRFRSDAAQRWPYFAETALYVRPDAGQPVQSLVQYLASRPYRRDFGLYGYAL